MARHQWLLIVAIVLAVGTLGFWLGTGGGLAAAFTSAVAVLIIACPCAYNVAALPLAAAGLLNPMLAAALTGLPGEPLLQR